MTFREVEGAQSRCSLAMLGVRAENATRSLSLCPDHATHSASKFAKLKLNSKRYHASVIVLTTRSACMFGRDQNSSSAGANLEAVGIFMGETMGPIGKMGSLGRV